MWRVLTTITVILFVSCKNGDEKLFIELPSSHTRVDFVNAVEDTDTLNILDYMYYYNGGGVALGDINNDSLTDIFFTANNGQNKLYLNKGDLVFEEVGKGAFHTGAWTTGVTMADVNADGLLDIYVSVVGDHITQKANGTHRTYFAGAQNKLFINKGNTNFEERSKEFGLDVSGYNTQAAFFDADRDGDLDMFQLQHSVHGTDAYGDTSLRHTYSKRSGGKLYINTDGKYVDETSQRGIISSALGYGLGVAIADFNNDGWDDIYVGNDFHENDYYYLNVGGRFIESSHKSFGHTSNFSMGNDVADINKDGWMDIITLDMLPANEKILKSTAGDRSFSVYNNQYSQGYNYQNARNCLQLNVGRGEAFSEIGLYAGVSATDWSWAPLLADFDLDGHTDLFISNGIKSRLNDLDYIRFLSDNSFRLQQVSNQSFDAEILRRQPPGKWHNFFFHGTDSLKFHEGSTAAGFERMNISNGAAYSDLDNDGDLDLVTNNFNEAASIFRNNSAGKNEPALRVSFNSNGPNTFLLGTKVILYDNGSAQYQQLQPTRGFMSSVEPAVFFTIADESIDSIVAITSTGHSFIARNVSGARPLVFTDKDFTSKVADVSLFLNSYLSQQSTSTFSNITIEAGLQWSHRENDFDDFNRQYFIPHQLSKAGPALSVGDINKDGMEDVFLGGAKGQASSIFLQVPGGKFLLHDQPAIAADSLSEDVDAEFFDADNDGDLDLYVVSGGHEFDNGHPALADRLYLNDGNGSFTRSRIVLPATQKSCMTVADIDQDGDQDIFLGGLADPRQYGVSPRSYLLINDGRGVFNEHEADNEQLNLYGMISDAQWADLDNNGFADLVLVGEWMAPTVFYNEKGRLTNGKKLYESSGWWTTVEIDDINGDGKLDVLLGNYGLNSKLTPPNVDGRRKPLKMFIVDADKNRSPDQLLTVYKEGHYYPFLNKEDLERQLPYLKKTYLGYSEMAGKTMQDIFGESLNNSKQFEAETFESLLLLSNKKSYDVVSLPVYQQQAPVMCFVVDDFNSDGKKEWMAAGNFSGVMPYEGKYDALFPSIASLPGINKGNSYHVNLPLERSLHISGDVREIKKIKVNGRRALIIARNNAPVTLLAY